MNLFVCVTLALCFCYCSIEDGKVQALEGELSKGKLENNRCYLLDCGVEVFVWFGRVTQLEDRKAACHSAEVLFTCLIFTFLSFSLSF